MLAEVRAKSRWTWVSPKDARCKCGWDLFKVAGFARRHAGNL